MDCAMQLANNSRQLIGCLPIQQMVSSTELPSHIETDGRPAAHPEDNEKIYCCCCCCFFSENNNNFFRHTKHCCVDFDDMNDRVALWRFTAFQPDRRSRHLPLHRAAPWKWREVSTLVYSVNHQLLLLLRADLLRAFYYSFSHNAQSLFFFSPGGQYYSTTRDCTPYTKRRHQIWMPPLLLLLLF